MDSLSPGLNRPQILWLLSRMQSRTQGHDNLFAPPPPTAPKLPAFSKQQRMEAECAALGYLIGAHPLAMYEDQLREIRHRAVSSLHLKEYVGKRVTLLGWPVTGKVVSTRKKEPMEFVSFEDFDSIYETVLFPKAYRRYAKMVEKARPYLVTGKVESEWEAVTVTVERVETLATTARAGNLDGTVASRIMATAGNMKDRL